MTNITEIKRKNVHIILFLLLDYFMTDSVEYRALKKGIKICVSSAEAFESHIEANFWITLGQLIKIKIDFKLNQIKVYDDKYMTVLAIDEINTHLIEALKVHIKYVKYIKYGEPTMEKK